MNCRQPGCLKVFCTCRHLFDKDSGECFWVAFITHLRACCLPLLDSQEGVMQCSSKQMTSMLLSRSSVRAAGNLVVHQRPLLDGRHGFEAS
jgi:hypothetical protein